MNPWLYIALIVGGHVGTAVLAFFGAQPATTEAAPFAVLPLLVGTVGYLMWIHRMWSSLPADARRTGPGKALGLLFVPLFNIYWVFNVIPGFATDFNRHNPRGSQVSFGLLVATVLLMAVPVLNWILFTMAILNVSKAVNAVGSTGAARLQPALG